MQSKRSRRWLWWTILGCAVTLVACIAPVSGPATSTAPVAESATATPGRLPPLTIVATLTPDIPGMSSDVPSGLQPVPQSSPAVETEHTVQPGETLSVLAATYGVPMAAIQLQNGLGASTVVRAGQVLAIPSASDWEGASTYWSVYEIAPGDTLSEIAGTYNLDVASLRAVNNLASDDVIVVGQPLVLPLDVPVDLAARAPAPMPVPLPTPTPAPVPPAAVEPSPTATATAISPTAAPLPADIAAWPREVWRIMNATRAEHGLPPYAYNDVLARAAQLHAEDCSQRQGCSHLGSDGATIEVRIIRAGYDPVSWSECWALRPSPQGVIDIWMDEVPPDDAHRRTVLHTWFTEVGIGVAPSPWDGYYYVIADFGRPN